MEQLNRVELKGRVGAIRITEAAGRRQAVLSVVTEHIYKNISGQVSIDTCWIQVSGWESPKVSFERLEKGSAVHVVGRLRGLKHIDASGCDRSTVEVVAGQLERIEEDIDNA